MRGKGTLSLLKVALPEVYFIFSSRELQCFFTAYIIVVVVKTYQIQKNSIDTPNIFDQL